MLRDVPPSAGSATRSSEGWRGERDRDDAADGWFTDTRRPASVAEQGRIASAAAKAHPMTSGKRPARVNRRLGADRRRFARLRRRSRRARRDRRRRSLRRASKGSARSRRGTDVAGASEAQSMPGRPSLGLGPCRPPRPGLEELARAIGGRREGNRRRPAGERGGRACARGGDPAGGDGAIVSGVTSSPAPAQRMAPAFSCGGRAERCRAIAAVGCILRPMKGPTSGTASI